MAGIVLAALAPETITGRLQASQRRLDPEAMPSDEKFEA